ncbi:aromatic ring-hydroxylating oxygenase subunit alpha [Sulfuracidifex tepidarius]|uniref:aromatic ring-hydroxylating oxygenase subunit alpha n=1 Tax=Sulfuracidifex tepidarius TaxID=1294262 RepID=UPI0021097FF8|nr:aromatic ring-hydroxylating dioxygenase subunit alpha [Sulfuracidifex tepidarius]
MGDVPVIITKHQGKIMGFLNVCPHRGAKIIREDVGKGEILRCPYHGWTFNMEGKFLGAPMQRGIYQGVDTSSFGMFPIRCETYKGLVFCTIDSNATLDEFLGDMKFFIDIVAGRSEGLVFSSPQRWIVRVNWKTIVDNFIGDSWHFLTAHGWLGEVGLGIQDLKLTSITGVIRVKGGHGVLFTGPSADDYPDIPRPLFYPLWWPNLVEKAKVKLTQREFDVWKKYGTYEMLGHVFPNMAFGNVAYTIDSEPPVPILTFRLWRPISTFETEIWTWLAFDKDEPENLKKKAIDTFLRLFGAAGSVEHDDVAMWESMTENSSKLSSLNLKLKYYGGMNQSPTQFEGPGELYYGGNNEGNTISFFKEYLNYLEGEELDDM